MGKTIDMFVCNKMYGAICNANITGQTACETCQENKCKNCGRLNTNFCLKCDKGNLSDEMKQKIKDAFLRRRNA